MQTLKVLTGHAYQEWLDQEENADMWYDGNENKLSAGQSRTLITQWVRDAWDKLCGPTYANLQARCWQKTACLITADGSEDDLVTPEGLPGYKVPAPLLYLPVSDAVPTTKITYATEDQEDADDEQLEQDMEEPGEEGEEWEHNEDDQYYYVEYCGRKIKAHYENGWFEGTLEYFNNDMKKYRMTYTNGSEGYIGLEDMDGVEVILMA